MKKYLKIIAAFIFVFCLVNMSVVSFADEKNDINAASQNQEETVVMSEWSIPIAVTVSVASLSVILGIAAIVFLNILLKRIEYLENIIGDMNENNFKLQEKLLSEKIAELSKDLDKHFTGFEEMGVRFTGLEKKVDLLRSDSENPETVRENSKSSDKRAKPTTKSIITDYLNNKISLPPKGFELKKLHIEEGNVRLSYSETDAVKCYLYKLKTPESESEMRAYIFPIRELAVERGDARYDFYAPIYDFEEETGRTELIEPCKAIVGINGDYKILQKGMICLK